MKVLCTTLLILMFLDKQEKDSHKIKMAMYFLPDFMHFHVFYFVAFTYPVHFLNIYYTSLLET